MKARPTVYRGIPMRSRLEAHYASRLDAAGWVWEYEPSAFGGQRGQYLPDFRLPNELSTNIYIEVRPTLEHALSALTQMLVIRESEPDCRLFVAIPNVGVWFNGGDRWRWFAAPNALA